MVSFQHPVHSFFFYIIINITSGLYHHLRYTIVGSRLHVHLYHSRSFDVPLSAGRGVFPADFTGLVETMWLHSSRVIPHKHPQNSRIHFTIQLKVENKINITKTPVAESTEGFDKISKDIKLFLLLSENNTHGNNINLGSPVYFQKF